MKIPPHVNLLKSLRGFRLDYGLLIGEGTDNAFDADAHEVVIEMNDEQISFVDNGTGVTRDRISSLFSLGEHGSMPTTQLGRFGIGLKSQAICAGDIMEVESTSLDGRFIVKVNWRDLIEGGRWEMPDPKWLFQLVGKTGSKIRISGLRFRPKVSEDKLIQELSQRFYPALSTGKKLIFNDIEVPALCEPEMVDVIDVHLALSGQRTAHLRAGILKNPPSPLWRVHVSYKHRVIMPQSTIGCKEYGGLDKMFARIQLGGRWSLGQFKADLPNDDEREELDDKALEAMLPILEKCNASGMSARLADMKKAINDLVPPRLSPRRPHHAGGIKKPSTKPKRPSSRGQVSADKSDPGGPAIGAASPQAKINDSLIITFDGNETEHGIGNFTEGRPHRVDLSKDNPVIAALLKQRQQNLAIRVLFTMALMIFEDGRAKEVSAPELQFEGFGRRVARHLKVDDSLLSAPDNATLEQS